MPDESALDRIKRRQLSRPQVPERGSPYEVNGSREPETIERPSLLHQSKRYQKRGVASS
jgi:hypothetical protein